MKNFKIKISDEVENALRDRRPVVALESTIFSHLGLPSPSNFEALTRCTNAIRRLNAVPAITVVLDGVARVGVDDDARVEQPLRIEQQIGRAHV